jgi:hypothetical protein
MRTLTRIAMVSAAACAGVLLAIGGCSSTIQAPAIAVDGGGEDATTIGPGYCTKLCDDEANAGTLKSSLAACKQQCCDAHPEGCSDSVDSGTGAGDGAVDSSPRDGGGADGDGASCKACGTRCCTANETCVTDTNGSSCQQTCAKSSECPSTAQCCQVLADGQSACTAATDSCRCAVPADCVSGCCAPMTNASGDPVGPYVCKPDDGADYDCCKGLTVRCGADHCCVKDNLGNEFCAAACATDSDCGQAHCQSYIFSSFVTTCSGPTACGP